jgi:hypothetical protein
MADEEPLTEHAVEVVYLGPGWRVSIDWTTDFTSDDDALIEAATEWFEEASGGWNPADDAYDVKVMIDLNAALDENQRRR